MRIIIFIFVLAGLISVLSQPAEDKVDLIIPGYPARYPWYSGYLNISKTSALHYVFFTSQSNATSDPVLLWLNGGPGCSSLIGMLHQNGPFVFKTNSTVFGINPYAWNKRTNLLYIESPGQVGFSIANTSFHSDQSVANDNLEGLKAFYAKFPYLRQNELYLSGQSYAGIYLPTLAYAIHLYNNNPNTTQKMNFIGFIVGNACTDPNQCYVIGKDGQSLFHYEYLYKHAFITEELYNSAISACSSNYNSTSCIQIRNTLDNNFGSTNTSINNIYSKCYYQSYGNKKWAKLSSPHIRGDLGCDDSLGPLTFLNDLSVRNYLHVGTSNTSFQWSACNGPVYTNFKSNPNASYYYYPILMKAGYRIWVFNGDHDSNVPITGSVYWISKLKREYNIPILQSWREWWVKGNKPNQAQVGGNIWKLQNLTFVSVKGAGHMVPTDQPSLAYTMLDAFLDNKNLPRLNQQIK